MSDLTASTTPSRTRRRYRRTTFHRSGSRTTPSDVDVTALGALVREAGARLRALIASPAPIELRAKHARDFVTAGDRESEAVLIAGLRRLLPGARIVSEETPPEPAGNPLECYVDPLDGTTNFAHRHPAYCVSVGIVAGGEPVAGAVYAPFGDELFLAAAGKGATLNGVPIRVSAVDALDGALLCAGMSARSAHVAARPFFRGWETAHAVRHDGSAALDLAYVAAGRYDAFWEPSLKPWDLAAGILLVREAGGTVTDFTGSPLSFAEGSVVASNGRVHAAVRALIA